MNETAVVESPQIEDTMFGDPTVVTAGGPGGGPESWCFCTCGCGTGDVKVSISQINTAVTSVASPA